MSTRTIIIYIRLREIREMVNKSELMSRAWEIRKTDSVNMSVAMRKAWAEFKSDVQIDVNGIGQLVLRRNGKAFFIETTNNGGREFYSNLFNMNVTLKEESYRKFIALKEQAISTTNKNRILYNLNNERNLNEGLVA